MKPAPDLLSDADLTTVRELVRAETGTVLSPDKGYLVEARLAPLVVRERSTLAGLIARLRGEPRGELHRVVVEAMLTGETTFFRDVTCFDALRKLVLPRLAATPPSRRLTIWSAACSSGQELYSVAMLLADGFPELVARTTLVGTDLSQAALARARAGRYSQFEVNRGLPASALVTHFDQDGEAWAISPRIRAAARFEHLNLVAGTWPYLPLADVVLLRNVMIYWDHATRREVLGRVQKLLRPDGLLVLGAAESTGDVSDAFERVPDPGSSCCFRLRTDGER